MLVKTQILAWIPIQMNPTLKKITGQVITSEWVEQSNFSMASHDSDSDESDFLDYRTLPTKTGEWDRPAPTMPPIY